MGSGRPAVSTARFWEGLYAERQDGWELGAAAPPLAAWLDAGGAFTTANVGRGGSAGAQTSVSAHLAFGCGSPSGPPHMERAESPRLAVLGCGRGHDARLLARRGYRVWGFDFAEAAVGEARALAAREQVEVVYERRDIFTLGRDHGGFFDAVWEYTCFCAIDPGRREEYARLVHSILRPGGTLLACFYPLRDGTDGPPFPVSEPEIRRVLEPWFTIIESGPPAASVERRHGLEWLVRAQRPGR